MKDPEETAPQVLYYESEQLPCDERLFYRWFCGRMGRSYLICQLETEGLVEIKQPSKQYKSTHSLVFSCQYHVIFCPKYRRRVLTNDIDTRLKELILEKQQEYQYTVLDMGIMPDHVHLLLDVNPQVGVVKIVGKIKGYTAHVLRKEFPVLKSRLPSLWTRGKFISSVGAVTLEAVKKYIESQKGI